MFLGTDYHMFGIHVVMSLIRGEDWRVSTRFPRVTLCDFEVLVLTSIIMIIDILVKVLLLLQLLIKYIVLLCDLL